MNGRFTLLVRHFVSASLAPDVLTETGADYFRRVLFGVLAMLLVLGSFVTRLFFDKYMHLQGTVGSGPYLRAVQADSLAMVALPMLIIGLAAVIAGPLLFPDETDYRVLSPLPISRAFLFGAKVTAVLVIITAAIVAVNVVASFWFPIAVSGRKATHPLLSRIVAHGIAATVGSYFMCFAIMALQGLTIVVVPAAWQRKVAVAVQGTLCVLLLLSLPVVLRLAGLEVNALTIRSGMLAWMPPAWFYGIEQWWLDGEASGGYAIAARIGLLAMGIAVSIVGVCYAVLYRSAERLAGVAGAERGMRPTPGALARLLASRLPAPTLAIVEFVRCGITRSRLHQFVFLFAVGGGVALLIGNVVSALEGVGPMASRPGAALHAAIAAPMIMALTFMIGLRAAYRWPLDQPAAWIFRITENPQTRATTLNGAAWCLVWGGWSLAMVVLVLLQPRMLGVSSVPSAMLTTLAVAGLGEFLLLTWQRIPFACSYLPGARVLAYHIGVLAAQFFVFVVIGSNLIRWAVLAPSRSVAIGGLLVAVWAALRRARLESWGVSGLEFEDADPAEVSRLGLHH